MSSRLRKHVHIAPRFQRSIRIDSDIANEGALEGFLCPPSSVDVLVRMARHAADAGHTAFTWTGPYGTGKSSLALAFCAALSGARRRREAATRALGKAATAALQRAFPLKSAGWRVVPIVGRRAPLAQLVGEALDKSVRSKHAQHRWTDARALAGTKKLVTEQAAKYGGVVIVLDELGKVLEGAAQDGHDIYLLQELAELAVRSEGRLIIVAILHQAFEEYARRLAREARDEWAKIQGRFVDLVVSTTGDEQLELLSRAITADCKSAMPRPLVNAVAALVRAAQPNATERLSGLLTGSWPLHPVTACLLGPLSRRRFGQNQRSLFAFLNSAEPHGLQDFLSGADKSDLYMPDRLWDYLRVNLEPAILASPDGHRWSLGVDALERCASFGASSLHVALLKTISLLELFRERSGLSCSPELLALSVQNRHSRAEIKVALEQLAKWSCIIPRRHLGTVGLFAGSDFDVEDAVATSLPTADAVDLSGLRALAGLQPLLAKRHYHTSGAIRWFHVELVRLHDLAQVVAELGANEGAAGRFIIAIPMHQEPNEAAKKVCAWVAQSAPPNLVVGLSEYAWQVVELARELLSLQTILEERAELRGDAVARREVTARQTDVRSRLEATLQQMMEATYWYRNNEKPSQLTTSELNHLASRIADERYNKAPCVLNELLNRDYPSSQAVKAQRELMKRMLGYEGAPGLGFEGWPAEAGLFHSIILASRLYRQTSTGWRFVAPTARSDPARLLPLWGAALDLLQGQGACTVSLHDVYALWRKPPFGLKEGLLPIFATALYLVHREHLVVYRQGIFQSGMSELDVDLITSDPTQVHFRWVNVRGTTERILSGLTALASSLHGATAGKPTTLEVARRLIAAYDALPSWTRRTMEISAGARRLSELLRHAADPNRLLFDDLPRLAVSEADSGVQGVDATIAFVGEGFAELQAAYPKMLEELERILMAELEVAAGKTGLAQLRERAKNLHQMTGDLRLNAFISRLMEYAGSPADREGIAGLVLEKRPQDWVDADVARARLSLAEFSQAFKQHEAFTRVAGRPDKRHRMAVIVPRDGSPRALLQEFDVTDYDRVDIDALIGAVENVLKRSSQNRQSIVLAALAELSARYMQPASASVARSKRKTA